MTNSRASLEEQIAKLVAGELSLEQAREVEAQIRQSPEAQEYLRALETQARQLADYAESLGPAVARLEERVIDRIDRMPAAEANKRPERWRMIVHSRLSKLAAAVLLLALLIAVLHRGEPRATSTIVDGVVKVRSAGSRDWVRRGAGQPLNVGDDLRLNHGAAVIRLPDDTRLTLNAQSELTLTGRTTESRFSVYLQRGAVTAKVGKVAQEADPFEVASSLGVVRSLGTEFVVRLAENVLIERRMIMRGLLPIAKRIMAVTVIAGAVQVQADGKEVVVEAGTDGVLVGDGPLTGPEAQAVVQRLMLSSEVVGPLKPFLQAHDVRLQTLFEAIAAGELEQVQLHADIMSEIWQPVGWLARAKFCPSGDRDPHDFIRRFQERASRGELDEDDAGTRLFLAHVEELKAWMDRIADPAWGQEIIHVAHQVEEYSEEIRDGGRTPELGLAYVEHCLPGFIAYCEWFKRLPWDDPALPMTLSELLAGIDRDLSIAHRELVCCQIPDGDRFGWRCTRQVQENTSILGERIADQGEVNEARVEDARGLLDAVNRLSTLFDDVRQGRHQLLIEGTRGAGVPFRLALNESANGGRPAGDLIAEQIQKARNLCAKLRQEVGSRP